jgi:hypothetical protein
MSLMTVDRLRTTFHSPVPIADERRDAWQSAFAAQDGESLAAGLVREDEWLLIRHLRIVTRWRADEVDADVGQLWARALRRSIDEALAGGDDANCIRYSSRREAMADMLYRSALGERTRQWAWQRMDLIERADVDCGGVIDSGVRQLLQSPESIWPVLQRIVAGEEATAALTALLRAMPASAWPRLFAACPQAAAYARWMGEAIHGSSPGADDPTDEPAMRSSPAAQRLLAWAQTRSLFVQRHVDTLAVLLAALTWPASGSAKEVSRQRARLARARLAAALSRAEVAKGGKPPSSHAAATREAHHEDTPVEQAQRPRTEHDEPAPRELPKLPDTTGWQATRHAGLLFWLSRIAAIGVFEWLDELPDAPAGGLRLLLRELALAMAVPDDDPAFAVFCGGAVPQAEAPSSIVEKARSIVDAWSRWLADAAPDLLEPRITTVCQRDGRLRLEPGWVELHLPLASVDTSIRRIALDLDPGWLPWLGCVVRIHYDE